MPTTLLIVALASPASHGHRITTAIVAKDFFQEFMLQSLRFTLKMSALTAVAPAAMSYVDRRSHTAAETLCVFLATNHTVHIPEDMAASQ